MLQCPRVTSLIGFESGIRPSTGEPQPLPEHTSRVSTHTIHVRKWTSCAQLTCSARRERYAAASSLCSCPISPTSLASKRPLSSTVRRPGGAIATPVAAGGSPPQRGRPRPTSLLRTAMNSLTETQPSQEQESGSAYTCIFVLRHSMYAFYNDLTKDA